MVFLCDRCGFRAINNELDYTKACNYWRWLKKKLTSNGIQLVSGTHDFKLDDRELFMKGIDYSYLE